MFLFNLKAISLRFYLTVEKRVSKYLVCDSAISFCCLNALFFALTTLYTLLSLIKNNILLYKDELDVSVFALYELWFILYLWEKFVLMDMPVLVDQQELTYNILCRHRMQFGRPVWSNGWQEQRERERERERECVQAARLDDGKNHTDRF